MEVWGLDVKDTKAVLGFVTEGFFLCVSHLGVTGALLLCRPCKGAAHMDTPAREENCGQVQTPTGLCGFRAASFLSNTAERLFAKFAVRT